MFIFIKWYFSVGRSIYIIFMIKRHIEDRKYIFKQQLIGILKGFFFSIFLWPIALWMMEIK